MRIPKRISAIFMAVIMLLSMGLNGLSVSAAPTEGTITIHKYEGTTISEHDGSVISDTSGFGTALEGIQFNIYKAKEGLATDLGAILGADGKYYVKDGSALETLTTGNTGAVTSSILSLGIYYVEEVGVDPAGVNKDKVFTKVSPFIVQLPMTNFDGDEHIYNVHVYPKNQEFVFKKEPVVSEGSNIVSWEITATIPEDIPVTKINSIDPVYAIDDLIKYVITDTFDSRLIYNASSLVVRAVDSDGDLVTNGTLIKDTDYTATLTGQKLEIKITKAGFLKLAGLTSAETLNITFDTMIDMDQIDPTDWEAIYNDADLVYTNENGTSLTKNTGEEPGTDPEDPFVVPFGFKIQKVDGNDALIDFDEYGGATFYIFGEGEFTGTAAEKAAAAQAAAQAAIDVDPDDTTAFNAAVAKALKNPNSTPVANAPWFVTTDDTGYVNLYGLTEGTYYLAETDAPDGYNKLQAPIKVVIAYDADAKTYTYTVGSNAPSAPISVVAPDPEGEVGDTIIVGGIVPIKVTNTDGFKLPLTGGAGTMLFTLIGLLLIGAAIVIYTISKKRKEQHA